MITHTDGHAQTEDERQHDALQVERANAWNRRCHCEHPDHLTIAIGSYGPDADHVPVSKICASCRAQWQEDVFLSDDLLNREDNGNPYNVAALFVADTEDAS